MKYLFLTSLILLSLPACAEEEKRFSAEQFKSITGLEWSEAQSCKADPDCTIIPSLSDCCSTMAVNANAVATINIHRARLWTSFTPEDRQQQCAVIECAAPQTIATCRSGICVAVPESHSPAE